MTVVPLRVVEVGDGAKIAADKVLNEALGNLQDVVVIGWELNGDFYFAGSGGGPDTLWLIEQAKRTLFADE